MGWQFYNAQQNISQLRTKVTDFEVQQIARLLSADEKATLIAALSPFSGQKVSIWCLVSAWDCNAFGRRTLGLSSERQNEMLRKSPLEQPIMM
jgi:hypothetical protein